MKKHFTLMVTCLFCFMLNSYAQTNDTAPDEHSVIWSDAWYAKNYTFEEIDNSFKEYWKDREVEKGKGYKPYMRWKTYVEPRIYPSGDLTLPSSTYANYMEWKREQLAQNRSAVSNWTTLGPLTKPTGDDTGVGRLNIVRFSPNFNSDNTLYVGAPDGGLWKSTNGGSSWTTNTDMLSVIGVSDLAIHPTMTNIMYLATGDIEGDTRSMGVLKSTDGGTTWNTTGLSWTNSDNYRISRLLMDPIDSDVLLAATDGGVFRTDDGGVTWNNTNNDGVIQDPDPIVDFRDMIFHPGNSNIVYAAGTSFWKSTDNGVSFTEITSGVPSGNVIRMALAVSPDEPNWVYILAGESPSRAYLGLYRSTDSGSSFTTRSTSPNILGYVTDGTDAGGQADYDLTITASPTDADLITIGGVNTWQSTNGGSTWTINTHWDPSVPGFQFVHADIHFLTYGPETNNTTIYSCNDGGLAKSVDNGATWTDISNNLSISQQNSIGISSSNASVMVAGLQDIGTIYRNGSWQVVGGGDGEDSFIDRTNDNVIIITGTNGSHQRSDNGPAGPFNDIDGLPTGSDALFFSPIRQDPVDADKYYAGGRANLYVSSDQGENWSTTGAAPFGSTKIVEFVVAPSDPTIIYALVAGGIAKSTNSGSTWTDVTGSLPTGSAALSNLTISDSNPDKVWVTFSGYSSGNKVWKTENGGTSWTNLSNGLPNIPANTIVFQNGSTAEDLYVGMDVGVYHIDNMPGISTTWSPFASNLPNVRVKDLRIFYQGAGKLRAATYGRGAWESDLFVALPVELVSFTGTNQRKTNVLNWITATEENLNKYIVERSAEGKRFEAIGQVRPASANSNSQQFYRFTDHSPTNGINYYRLNIQDIDGQYEYSTVIVLYVEDRESQLKLFPNPVVNRFNIDGLGEEDITIRMINAVGRTMWMDQINASDEVDVSNFPNGVYFIEILTKDGAQMIKQFVKE